LAFDVAIVNLGSPPPGVVSADDWAALVRHLKQAGIKVIAHAGHKEHELRDLGRAAGCDVLATNGEMAHHLGRVLARALRRLPRIAVTGGVAEGKSTVLATLAELGYTTASADEVAATAFESEGVQALICDELGASADRVAVRVRLSQDAEFRRRLNALMHPIVARQLLGSEARFVEVPLLLEATMHPFFDRVWVVTCGEAEQRRRLVERLGSPSEADALLRVQLPTQAKIPFADEVVRTNQDEETVRAYVRAVAARSEAP
jgi:dephospho-CoA kinase